MKSIQSITQSIKQKPISSAISGLVMLTAVISLYYLVNWGLINAVFFGSAEDCQASSGACWVPVIEGGRQLVYGDYPEALWRVNLSFILGLIIFPLLLVTKFNQRFVLYYVLLMPFVILLLIKGGILGLEPVVSINISGILLTFVLAVFGMCFSLPVALLLALGRLSKMPVIRYFCTFYIEFIRSVPSLTFFFLAILMGRFFFPPSPDGSLISVIANDRLVRVILALIILSAAYKAEIIRGAILAIPKGQVEAAEALGTDYWKTTAFIILPQAVRYSIPALISNFIGLVKETTLIQLVGMTEFTKIAESLFSNADWASYYTEHIVLISMFFFVICFSISRFGLRIEKRLGIKTGYN